ncbi:pyruvate dehydrogenase [Streptomyces sp. NBRC 109706]|uniref:transketolase-like TK C-terminal-containing protein n=1 Tax=Streptomyces sp. NBRC 109706 TaxID=1550035 RepID=UPI00099B25FA|nr:pyruvate dehydrogenase [Streptomyces sp. NBRC 109706]
MTLSERWDTSGGGDTTGLTPRLLDSVERRVRWLSTAIVDHANRVRSNPSGLKVGGHQASSASMTSLLTALWFGQLTAQDRVSVKPHASPVLHAVNYLLGELPAERLTTLRAFGGLQSYPSRTKDPDTVDYSTGSVGIGATAPLWGALAHRLVRDRFGEPAPGGRQYSLLGDAELDEGAVWEALRDPLVAGLGEVVWVVDLNRQSLDRVVPGSTPASLEGMFAAAGWQVLTLKYGSLLAELFGRPGGAALRARLDGMGNAEYQRLLRCPAEELRHRLPAGDGSDGGAGQEDAGADPRGLARLVDELDDATLLRAVRDLGGHDMASLLRAFRAVDDTRPTVILAYTVKGYGLPVEGHPQNHSGLLTAEQMKQLAQDLGTDLDDPWAPFPEGTPEARLCAATAERLRRPAFPPVAPPTVPPDSGRTAPTGLGNTQQALGRALLELTRSAPEVARRIVTASPDVTSSTNLGGWLNKVGVWSPTDRRDWFTDDRETLLHWRESPAGQHVELGIAETNLVGLLGELGATWSRWGRPLFPIGVLYDPFVNRALEPWSFGIYAGGQSILVGTPSGVSLAPEGGAHQSITTPSLGIEQPGCVSYEPAFAIDTEWCLRAALSRLGRPGGESAYLRLSTRPVDQSLAAVPTDPAARERRRRQATAGGYVLRHAGRPAVTLVAMGALVTEAIQAGERLADLGHDADVVCVTSADLLFRATRGRSGLDRAEDWILDRLLPAHRAAPMVTLVDGHPHTLAFLATVRRVPLVSLGVTDFGQSGSIDEVYRHHGIDTDSVVGAALDLIETER